MNENCQRDPLPVSVVIPVYNNASGAKSALWSVLNQTLKPMEIIIVDDASATPLALSDILPDRTSPNILAAYPPVHIVRHPGNLGAAQARNTGIEKAVSEFIAFLDSDDTWHPEKLAIHMAHILKADSQAELKHPVAYVTGFKITGGQGLGSRSGGRNLVPAPALTVQDFASGCWYCPGSTMIMRKDALAGIGAYCSQLRRFEDIDLGLRIGYAGGHVDVCPGILSLINVERSRSAALPVADVNLLLALHTQHLAALSRSHLRRFRSYLALELAAQAWRRSEFAAFAWFMTKSLYLKPRLSAHLGQFWREAA